MSKKTLRAKLLQKESYDPSLEAAYQEAKNRMFQKSLSPAHKIVWFVTGFLGLFFFVRFLYIGIAAPEEMPLTGRGLFLFSSVFGAIWAGLSAYVLKKGTFHMIRSDNFVNGLVLVFMILFMIACGILSENMEDKAQAMLMLLRGGLFFMVFGIPAVFNLRMNRMESNIREQLLILEMKFAEMEERTDEN